MPVVRVVADPPLDVAAIRRALDGEECFVDVQLDDRGVAVTVSADPRTDPAAESRVRQLVVEAIDVTRRAAADPSYARVLGELADLKAVLAKVLAAVEGNP